MKKSIIKSTLAVVAVAASCFGAWKTYDTYGSVDNSLMMENLEALSQGGDNGDNYVELPSDKYKPILDKYGTCWVDDVIRNWEDSQGYEHAKHRWRKTGDYRTCKYVPKTDYWFDPECTMKHCSGEMFEKETEPDPKEYQD